MRCTASRTDPVAVGRQGRAVVGRAEPVGDPLGVVVRIDRSHVDGATTRYCVRANLAAHSKLLLVRRADGGAAMSWNTDDEAGRIDTQWDSFDADLIGVVQGQEIDDGAQPVAVPALLRRQLPLG